MRGACVCLASLRHIIGVERIQPERQNTLVFWLNGILCKLNYTPYSIHLVRSVQHMCIRKKPPGKEKPNMSHNSVVLQSYKSLAAYNFNVLVAPRPPEGIIECGQQLITSPA